jgi:hypothetical protein
VAGAVARVGVRAGGRHKKGRRRMVDGLLW